MADPAPAPAGPVPSASLPAPRATDLAPPAVEMDTADDEEASSSWEALRSSLLPPDGRSLPVTAAGTFPPAFALLVNGCALNAWVKQPSPSCAAAVVAGAWNALACADGRRDARANSTRDVLDAMVLGAEQILDKKKARFARLLGVRSESFDAFERAVLKRIAVDPSGQTLGGRSKHDPAMKRAAVMRLVEETAFSGDDDARVFDENENEKEEIEIFAEASGSPKDVAFSRPSAFAAVAALLREEREALMAAANVNENAPPSGLDRPGFSDAPATASKAQNVFVIDAAAAEEEESFQKLTSKKKKKTRFPRRLGPPSAAFGGGVTVASAGDAGEGDDGDAHASDAETDATVCPYDDEDEAEDDAAADVDVDETRGKTKPSRGWAWRLDLWEMFKRRGGLEKLKRDKPSTAAFGNAEVMRAFLRLVEMENSNDGLSNDSKVVYSARVAIGVKTKTRTKLEAAVKKHVSSDEKKEAFDATNEWTALRSLFSKQGTFLVSHHSNHYAPVYALRERRDFVFDERTGTKIETETREMLTARRGQRPTCWIPWEEARGTMRRWSGYGIMAFERVEK